MSYERIDVRPVAGALGAEIRGVQLGEMDDETRERVAEIAKKFGVHAAKPVATPLEPGYIPSAEDCPATDAERELMRDIPYREIIGCLNFVATVSRPDISYAVSKLSSVMSSPGMPHWNAAKRVLKYLAGSQDVTIRYSRSIPIIVRETRPSNRPIPCW